MNRNDLRGGIARTWLFARSIGVGEAFSNPMPMLPNEEFIGAAFDPNTTYEDLYLLGLRNGDYNILFTDFAFLQFGISNDHHVRYAFYPNPFLGASTEAIAELQELRSYVAEGVISMEEYLYKVSEVRRTQHPPLMRYENAPDQYQEFRHPCSHLHLGHHSENRWPIQRVLTPLAFSMVIVRQFYSALWFKTEQVKVFGKEQAPDEFLVSAKLECRVLPDELFSPAERQLFFMA